MPTAIAITLVLAIIFMAIINIFSFVFTTIDHSVYETNPPKYSSIEILNKTLNTKKCIGCFIVKLLVITLFFPFFMIGRGLSDFGYFIVYTCWMNK